MRPNRPGPLRRILLALTFLLIAMSSLVGVTAPSQGAAPACPPSRTAGQHDYHGLTLARCNFNGQDLTNANFAGATLDAVIFIDAKLAGADFSGAIIADSGDRRLPTDFSFADLTRTKFVGTRFNGRTYLTQATLACTDFSQADISRGTAIFGDAPLKLGTDTSCRTRFVEATMNCEFIAQWNQLDLTRATISTCGTLLATAAGQPGHDFSGATLTGVVFDGLDLSRSKWQGATLAGASFHGARLDGATGLAGSNLERAVFSQASLQGVDLSKAVLYGAVFDLANLDRAKLQGAFLSPCPPSTPCAAATFRGAWLRDVDLSNSHLEDVIFDSASFYTSSGQASATGATLTRTDFTNAYLYGVDFSNAQMRGVKFDRAVLVAANFTDATLAALPDESGGSFANAYLQGVNFTGATLSSVTLSGAFVDFNANIALVLLDASHTRFAGWKTPGQPVCTRMTYAVPTLVPSNQSGLTACPDNTRPSAATGCGPTGNVPAASHWNNGIPIGTATPPASYRQPATFAPKATDLCTRDLNW